MIRIRQLTQLTMQFPQAMAQAVRKQLRYKRWRARRELASYADRFGIALVSMCVLLPLTVFAALTHRVKSGGAFEIERTILLALHSLEAVLLDHIALVMSMMVTVVALAMLAWLLVRRLWRTALFWLVAVGGAAILNSLIKKAVRRRRPELWDLVAPHSSFGFPSGHAMQSMAIAVALVVLFRYSRSRLQVVAMSGGFVVVVGLCRMYLGLHYPTDVLAGWTLSLAWVTSLALVVDERYLAIGTLRAPRRSMVVALDADDARASSQS